MKLFGQSEPETVNVLGKPLQCQVCGHNVFWQRRAQLYGAAASFFDLDWASPSCICVICDACGYVHWFFPQQ